MNDELITLVKTKKKEIEQQVNSLQAELQTIMLDNHDGLTLTNLLIHGNITDNPFMDLYIVKATCKFACYRLLLSAFESYELEEK